MTDSDFRIDPRDGALKKYMGNDANVIIPNYVQTIGSYAFYYCKSLKSVEMRDSITKIGDYAFQGCTNLTSITISNRVTKIGNFAFRDCTELPSIKIPDSVTEIRQCAFEFCKSLASVEIPNSVTKIGENAFYGCPNLTVHCNSGSYAEKYCEENNIPHDLIGYGALDWDNLFVENFNESIYSKPNKHSKTNKKNAQGWFTSLGGNPEVEKDFFNRATTFNNNTNNSNSTGENAGEGTGGAMGESVINERNLTRAERHRRDMDRIFQNYDRMNNAKAQFLIDKGVDPDEVERYRQNTGLGSDGLGQALIDLGLHDEFWNQYNKNESFGNVSDDIKKDFADLLSSLNLTINGQGKTMLGSEHFQIIDNNHKVSNDKEFREVVNPIVNAINKFEKENNANITWNFGYDDEGTISAGIDIHKIGNGELSESFSTFKYKDYNIDYNVYGGKEYSVQYNGDDCIFDTIDEAKNFIDEVSGYDDDISESFMKYKLM